MRGTLQTRLMIICQLMISPDERLTQLTRRQFAVFLFYLCDLLQIKGTVRIPWYADDYQPRSAVPQQRMPEPQSTMIVQQMFPPMDFDELGNNHCNEPP